MKTILSIMAMGNYIFQLLSLTPREKLPGKNCATDLSARDHPSRFLLALKETGRNCFPQLPMNSAFATASFSTSFLF